MFIMNSMPKSFVRKISSLVLFAAVLSGQLANASSPAENTNAQNAAKKRRVSPSRMVMLGICIDQVLMQQGIVLQLPPVNQKPSWDPATKSAFMQATYQCKSQMRASAQLNQTPSGLIIMPQIPSSPNSPSTPPAVAPQPPTAPVAIPATLGVQGGSTPPSDGNPTPEAGPNPQGQTEQMPPGQPQEALPPGTQAAPGI
jgi:hypothetical protein